MITHTHNLYWTTTKSLFKCIQINLICLLKNRKYYSLNTEIEWFNLKFTLKANFAMWKNAKNEKSTIYQIRQKQIRSERERRDSVVVSEGTSNNVIVRTGRRGIHWQSRKREQTPRVANRASDCRVLARIAS